MHTTEIPRNAGTSGRRLPTLVIHLRNTAVSIAGDTVRVVTRGPAQAHAFNLRAVGALCQKLGGDDVAAQLDAHAARTFVGETAALLAEPTPSESIPYGDTPPAHAVIEWRPGEVARVALWPSLDQEAFRVFLGGEPGVAFTLGLNGGKRIVTYRADDGSAKGLPLTDGQQVVIVGMESDGKRCGLGAEEINRVREVVPETQLPRDAWKAAVR